MIKILLLVCLYSYFFIFYFLIILKFLVWLENFIFFDFLVRQMLLLLIMLVPEDFLPYRVDLICGISKMLLYLKEYLEFFIWTRS
jgi:hypothetical protein